MMTIAGNSYQYTFIISRFLDRSFFFKFIIISRENGTCRSVALTFDDYKHVCELLYIIIITIIITMIIPISDAV